MGKKCFTYSEFFKEVDKDVKTAMDEVAKIIKDKWRDFVWERFYLAYDSVEYDRESGHLNTIDALSVLSAKKKGNIYEIEVGYDETKLSTFVYTGMLTGRQRQGHQNPAMQGSYVEYGFEMQNGKQREGGHALSAVEKAIYSGLLFNEFKKEMRQLGYTVRKK